jgi:hypothetical protein
MLRAMAPPPAGLVVAVNTVSQWRKRFSQEGLPLGSSRLSRPSSVGVGQLPPWVRCHNSPGSIASWVMTEPCAAGNTMAPGGHMLDKPVSGSGVDAPQNLP